MRHIYDKRNKLLRKQKTFSHIFVVDYQFILTFFCIHTHIQKLEARSLLLYYYEAYYFTALVYVALQMNGSGITIIRLYEIRMKKTEANRNTEEKTEANRNTDEKD